MKDDFTAKLENVDVNATYPSASDMVFNADVLAERKIRTKLERKIIY